MANSQRPSMADVAALAGVSAQTVSRVVNASPRVDPETRHRVEAALARSGYRVHRAARALRTGRTGIIGAVVSTLATVGNSLMLQSVVDEASVRGYSVVIARIGTDGPAEAFERLREQGVDGAIVVNEASALLRDVALPDELRLVVVDSPPDPRYAGIETAHADGSAAATRHLLELGHRTIAHIAGPDSSYAAAERERGWRETLTAAGCAPGPLVRAQWTSASGFEAGGSLMDVGTATAVVVANDQMALGMLRAATERGIRVPEQLSVVGFDDVDDSANYSPALTTLHQPFDELGRRAVAAVLGDAEPGSRDVVAAPLVVRASTGAISARA
ncbi:MAG: LacI family DNA-binding transcriptional regulator [Microbacterium sp.]|uniref:LacI family DNA-binding transcriptional regulator n=1 Tax=Microbacterium sp. TaxID=51671 RepID=UPI00271AE14A|nr:LacI family DNA-binding transcriptional regulator [Microbacterium sp.]MDO8384601.1 LacI family DNA-binding transcriptional regulator [Microbacterium sp.]